MRLEGREAPIPAHANAFTRCQYRPPSLLWSQLVVLRGMILRATRLGALREAPAGRAVLRPSPSQWSTSATL